MTILTASSCKIVQEHVSPQKKVRRRKNVGGEAFAKPKRLIKPTEKVLQSSFRHLFEVSNKQDENSCDSPDVDVGSANQSYRDSEKTIAEQLFEKESSDLDNKENRVDESMNRSRHPSIKVIQSTQHRKFFDTRRQDQVHHVSLNKKVLVSLKKMSKNDIENVRKSLRNDMDAVVTEEANKDKVPVHKKIVRAKKKNKEVKEKPEQLPPKPVQKASDRIPKYKLELVNANKSGMLEINQSNEDIYAFTPSQNDSGSTIKRRDSYIQGLIERTKKQKRPKKVKKVVKSDKKNKNQSKISKKKILERIEETPVRDDIQVLDHENSIEKTRKQRHDHTVDNTLREPLVQNAPNRSNVNKSVRFSLEESIDQEIHADSMVSVNKMLSIRDNSMMPPPIVTPPISGNSNIIGRRNIIINPIPSTSTGGWTTPSNKSNVSNPLMSHSINRSVNVFSNRNHERTRNSSMRSNVTRRRPAIKPKSPWRIDPEMRTPRTEYFSLSKDMLPSYTSDTIIRDEIPHISLDRNGDQSSLNSSDIENMAPVNTKITKEVLGMQQTVNKKKRSPLKPLDVREVLRQKHAPVTESPLTKHSFSRTEVENVPRVEVLSNVTLSNQQYRLMDGRLVREPIEQENRMVMTANKSMEYDRSNYFGFEDIDDSIINDEALPERELTISDLKEKLRELKYVGPLEKSQSIITEMPILFKSPIKQTNNLQTMFGTKMNKDNISTPLTIQKDQKQLQRYISSSDEEISDIENDSNKQKNNEDNGRIALFDDPEDIWKVNKEAKVTAFKFFKSFF